jgi:hypothetical protein
MKVHEKAALYEAIVKDYQELIAEMEKVRDDLQNIPNRPDLLEIKESQGYSMYTAGKCGCYAAMGYAIDWKISRAKGVLEWYENQK